MNENPIQHGGTAETASRDGATDATTPRSSSDTISTIEKVAEGVLDAAFRIHRATGPGLMESFYERVLERDLMRSGYEVERQKAVSAEFEGLWFKNVFYADLVVEGRLTVEVKSVSQILLVHSKQLLTYLRLQDHRLGLLLNFGAPYMKDGIKRVVNGL